MMREFEVDEEQRVNSAKFRRTKLIWIRFSSRSS